MLAAGSAHLGVYAVAVTPAVNDLDHVVRNAATDLVGASVDQLGPEIDRPSEAGGVNHDMAAAYSVNISVNILRAACILVFPFMG